MDHLLFHLFFFYIFFLIYKAYIYISSDMSQEFVSGKEEKDETGTERMKSTETKECPTLAQLFHYLCSLSQPGRIQPLSQDRC